MKDKFTEELIIFWISRSNILYSLLNTRTALWFVRLRAVDESVIVSDTLNLDLSNGGGNLLYLEWRRGSSYSDVPIHFPPMDVALISWWALWFLGIGTRLYRWSVLSPTLKNYATHG